MSRFADLEQARAPSRRALALGAARKPVDIPASVDRSSGGAGDQRVLGLLAALSWRARFDRPALPPRFAPPPTLCDPAAVVDAPVRTALRYVFRQRHKRLHPAVGLLVLAALRSRGRALHPFDYPALDALMKLDTALLDAGARAWVGARESDTGPIDDDTEIESGNWTDFPPAARATFLRELRAKDAAAARELCAATFGDDAAAVRATLLGTLAVGLSGDDVDFLQSLADDRAASVRGLAVSLIARISGTEAFEERLNAAKALLKVRSGLMVGKRRIVEPSFPKGLGRGKQREWIRDTFSNVSPMELAKSLDLDGKQLAAGIGSSDLSEVLFFNALGAGELEIADWLKHGIDICAMWVMTSDNAEALLTLSPECSALLWQWALDALPPKLDTATSALAILYGAMRRPVPAALGALLVERKRWAKWLEAARDEDFDDPEALEILVAVAPPVERAGMLQDLRSLSPAHGSRALALAELFDLIDQP